MLYHNANVKYIWLLYPKISHKTISESKATMNKKEIILKLYFEEHKTQELIAKEVSVTQSYL